MPSIPPSPLRLSHRHNQSQSSIDFDPISPGTYAPNGFSHSPPRSPMSPRFSAPSSPARGHHAQSLNGSHYRMSGDFGSAADMGGGGLGNLADELADAWEQEEGGYGYASGQEVEHIPADTQHMDRSDSEDGYHMGTKTPSSGYSSERASLQPPKPKTRNGGHRHRRTESQYDGSDYGPDSDLEEAADISPSLEMQMAEVESLARRGLENNGSESDHAIARVVEALRDLGGQSGIENNAMRYGLVLVVQADLLLRNAIDSLIPLIDDELLPNLPYPFPVQSRHSSRPATPSHSPALNPLYSLQSLVSQTSEITLSLQSLSDTLYESRQLTATASRRLRSARELVSELRREEEGREEGTRWIEKGDWDRRLRDREAGRECGDVVSGFEAVCGEWRERLFGAAGAEAAAAAA
ncbi:unnamed protein product [Aspergillus oryzae]|nr:unnamed protein product [Aspergillus oryzae]GMF93410.1 unnamed protein product [Aspergillus oryzae]